MLNKFVIAAGALAAFGTSVAMAAGTSTVQVNGGSMNVYATVQASCRVAVNTAVTFGSISIVPGSTASPGNFTVTCDNGTDYAVGISDGGHHNTTRNMALNTNSSVLLPYELYVDNSYQSSSVYKNVTLGDTVGGTPAPGTVGGTGTGNSVSYNVYGMIPNSATKPLPGDYSDSVTVTLIY